MKEEVWKAIIHCDPAYDGKFYYGVLTTGIFCRPSCKSKNPKRDNVEIFPSIDTAIMANFRPCKRCRPDQTRWPDEDLALQTMNLIKQRFQEVLTLKNLSELLHVSPYHLHRTFKRIVGLTPANYLRNTRLEAAKKLIEESNTSITDIAITTGFFNAAHFSTVFQKQFGHTPSAHRSQHEAYVTKEK